MQTTIFIKGVPTYFMCYCACHAHCLILNHHPDLNSTFISLVVSQVCWLPDSQVEVTWGWHEVTTDWNEHLYFHDPCPNESAFGTSCCNWGKCIWYKRKDRYQNKGFYPNDNWLLSGSQRGNFVHPFFTAFLKWTIHSCRPISKFRYQAKCNAVCGLY